MLRSLVIKNIVLIERLDLTFTRGLCVLTGETGAGKSIFLDALGLAIGLRAESRLVRHGQSEATVTAVFQVSRDNKVRELLDDRGLILDDDDIILRRILNADGSSKAFINDQPVSITFLRLIGTSLAEIHGQFENQRLLRASSHRELLDDFGKLHEVKVRVKQFFQVWRKIVKERDLLQTKINDAKSDEEFLLYSIDELKALAPQNGEEEKLATQRKIIANLGEIADAVAEALVQICESKGAEERLQRASTLIHRVTDKAEGRLDHIGSAIDRTINELSETINVLEKITEDLDLSPKDLDVIEERLFALRACARKHGVSVDELPRIITELVAKQTDKNTDSIKLNQIKKREAEAKNKYLNSARELTIGRRNAALALDKAVGSELRAIEMSGSTFCTQLLVKKEDNWGEEGADDISFLVSTNSGIPPRPLTKIVSGGEMARLMLAIKVVLAESDPISAIVFDEVDSGVGGAVASAVGERLLRLASKSQVLVVTHSPQVAAKGKQHMLVSKLPVNSQQDSGGQKLTSISVLNKSERAEEIARMLSGKEITDEARAAANSLLLSSV